MNEVSIEVEDIGGIDHLEQTFSNPVSIVTGSNASNKTSLLQAIAFGVGRTSVPVRSGASEARVELKIGDERIVRTATKQGRGTSTAGDCLLEDRDDVELFERFACLLEFNEIRQAVRDDRPVEDLLKEPMDLTSLEAQREEMMGRRKELKREIERLEDVEDEVVQTETDLEAKQGRIEDLETQLDDLRERQEEMGNSDDEAAQLREERASLVHDRNEHEEQLADLETTIERINENIEETRADLEAARETTEEYNPDELQSQRDEVQQDLDDIDNRIDILQSVLTANQEMLSSSYAGILGKESSLMEDQVTCWACGTEALVSEFDDTIDELQEIIERDMERRAEHEPKLEDIESRIAEAKEARRRVSDLEATVQDLESQLQNRRDSLETKREALAEIQAEIDDLDEKLADRETEQESAVKDLQDEIEETRLDLHAARSEVERLESSLEDLNADLMRRAELKDEVDELSEEIVDLSERIRTFEQDLRQGFNDAINELIEELEYDRLERIWLDGDFELVIAREVDDVVREDEVSNLSESEREMVGLTLALAGYIAYDVADVAPVLLIDTLGAFDNESIGNLIAYFTDEVPLLFTALLPDSAAAVDEVPQENEVVRTNQVKKAP